MSRSTRSKGRMFGRLKDSPGPQPSFEGQFQLDTAQTSPSSAGGSHQTFQARPTTLAQGTRTSLGSTSSPDRARPAREGASSSRHSQRQQTRHTQSAASTTAAPVSRLEAQAIPVAGPSRMRRTSAIGHRATQSNPTVQAASGIYTRARSGSLHSAQLSPETPDPAMVAGPSSWPRHVNPPTTSHVQADNLLPLSSAATVPFHGYAPPSQQALITSEYTSAHYGYSPALSSSGLNDTPSTGSLPLSSPSTQHFRNGSFELPGGSPTDTSLQQFASPSPHTPSSMRGYSVPPSAPPSVYSDPSPYMDFMLGEFSPVHGPTDFSDPPVTPDYVPDGLLWQSGNDVVRPHSVTTATTHHDPRPFGSVQYSQSSISVPEMGIGRSYHFPGDIFGSNEAQFAFSDVYGYQDNIPVLSLPSTSPQITPQASSSDTALPLRSRPRTPEL